MILIGETPWLRIPDGKHNDRYIPLHPQLVDKLVAWVATAEGHIAGLLLNKKGRRLDRQAVSRMLNRTTHSRPYD